LQDKLQNHLRSGGLDARLPCNHLEKGSDEEIIITMQTLGQKYPKFIYGMVHFEFGLNLQNRNLNQGVYCKFD